MLFESNLAVQNQVVAQKFLDQLQSNHRGAFQTHVLVSLIHQHADSQCRPKANRFCMSPCPTVAGRWNSVPTQCSKRRPPKGGPGPTFHQRRLSASCTHSPLQLPWASLTAPRAGEGKGPVFQSKPVPCLPPSTPQQVLSITALREFVSRDSHVAHRTGQGAPPHAFAQSNCPAHCVQFLQRLFARARTAGAASPPQ